MVDSINVTAHSGQPLILSTDMRSPDREGIMDRINARGRQA